VFIHHFITFSEEKSTPKMWGTSAIFRMLPIVNNRPMGDNSPNLVILFTTGIARWFINQTKNDNLGEFGRALEWKMWVCFLTIRNILRIFGLVYGRLVYFSRFGCLDREKSGNPVHNSKQCLLRQFCTFLPSSRFR
jgi:hypothetical protein